MTISTHRINSIQQLRQDFPILTRNMRGKPLVFLDSAASSQKPYAVIEAMDHYYRYQHANVHRGVYEISAAATDAFEQVRKKAQLFLNAAEDREIIFTRGTTEGINLVAATFGQQFLKPGDEIILTVLEHHSNIVPWQMAAARCGAKLRVVPINDKGELILEEYAKMLHHKTKLVAVGHVSNALGTVNPVKDMIRMAHAHGAAVLVDGAQATPHLRVDVQDLDADFYVFSGHKMYGPTGVGILYGKAKWLEALPPYHGGGEMIRTVSFSHTVYNEIPFKFEAGTPDIAGVIGLGAAFDYLHKIDQEAAAEYEHVLLEYGTALLSEIPEVNFIGTAPDKAGVISFNIKGAHPFDVGSLLDQQGVAVRTGHHCAQPLMEHLGIPGTVRASLALYNHQEDLDRFATALKRAVRMLV